MVRVAQSNFHAVAGRLRRRGAVHWFSRLILPHAGRSVSGLLRMHLTQSFDWPVDRAPIEDPAPHARSVRQRRLSGALGWFFPIAEYRFFVRPRSVHAEAEKR